jgi:hypothetical protein
VLDLEGDEHEVEQRGMLDMVLELSLTVTGSSDTALQLVFVRHLATWCHTAGWAHVRPNVDASWTAFSFGLHKLTLGVYYPALCCRCPSEESGEPSQCCTSLESDVALAASTSRAAQTLLCGDLTMTL